MIIGYSMLIKVEARRSLSRTKFQYGIDPRLQHSLVGRRIALTKYPWLVPMRPLQIQCSRQCLLPMMALLQQVPCFLVCHQQCWMRRVVHWLFGLVVCPHWLFWLVVHPHAVVSFWHVRLRMTCSKLRNTWRIPKKCTPVLGEHNSQGS